jgi:hypothetical protein
MSPAPLDDPQALLVEQPLLAAGCSAERAVMLERGMTLLLTGGLHVRDHFAS